MELSNFIRENLYEATFAKAGSAEAKCSQASFIPSVLSTTLCRVILI